MDSVTPSQVDGVLTILRAILAPDNQNRKRQELELQTLKTQHPNELVLCLLATARRVAEAEIRALAAVLLRQMMTALSASTSALWHLLRPEVKTAVKSEMLAAIRSETDKGVRRRLGDAVGELGATVLTAHEESWPELLPFLFTLATDADSGLVAAAMHMFAALFSFVHEQLLAFKQQIYRVLSSALDSPILEVKLSATEAVSTFLSTVDNREIPEFNTLLKPLLLAAFAIIELSETDGKDVVENLVTIAETEPKFYYPSFDLLIEFMERVFGLPVENGVKSLVLEIVVHVVDRKPKLLRTDQQRCVKVLDAVFRLMLSADTEVEESWLRPPEGFQEKEFEDEDSLDIDYAKTGRRVINRLIESVGDRTLLPLVLSAVRSLLIDVSDWRKKYTALMTLSQLGQFIGEPDKIADLVPILQSHCSPDLHPKIKYGVYHCIAQLCEDLEDDFRDPYHSQIAEMLHGGLSDTVPRVVAQCNHATSGFFSSCSHTIATSYSGGILSKLTALVAPSTPSIVIESALNAIAAIADANKEQFAQNYQQLVPFLVSIIRSYTAGVYKQLRGKAIECLTLMCSAVGREVFRPHVTEVVSLLKDIQETQLSPNDPQVSYILTAWQRLCITLKDEFSTYLPHVIPGLLAMATIKAAGSLDSNPSTAIDLEAMLKDDHKGKISVTTSDIEDKVVALETLLTIVDSMKGSFLQYIEQTMQLVLPLVHYTINEDVRGVSAGILSCLVIAAKESGVAEAPQKSAAMGKVFLAAIHPAMMDEFDADTLVSQLQAVKSIIEVPGYPHLSSDEVLSLGQEMIKLLQKSLEKRKSLDPRPDPDSDEEDNEGFSKMVKMEEDRVHTSISEVFGSLFKSHTDFSLPIVRYLFENVLRLFLDPSASEEDHKFGVYIIDDIVEYVGPGRVPEQWGTLAEAIMRYGSSVNDAVRQAACYGLGIFSQKTDPSLFTNWSSSVLQVLSTAISMPPGKSTRTFGNARDNAIAALGRVLRYQSQNVDTARWLPFWIKLLPAKFDKPEARLMHEQLATFLTQNSPLFLTPDSPLSSLLPHIVKVFGEVLDTKFVNAHTVPLIKSFFQELRQSPLGSSPTIWSSLTDLHKKRIAALIEH